MYGIERAPCDTALRERLDEVEPRQLRAVFKHVCTLLQRGEGLEGFTCLDGPECAAGGLPPNDPVGGASGDGWPLRDIRATPRGWRLPPGRATPGRRGSGPPYATMDRVSGNF